MIKMDSCNCLYSTGYFHVLESELIEAGGYICCDYCGEKLYPVNKIVWRDIKTVPYNTKVMFLYWDGSVSDGLWIDEDKPANFKGYRNFIPTHWMPFVEAEK